MFLHTHTRAHIHTYIRAFITIRLINHRTSSSQATPEDVTSLKIKIGNVIIKEFVDDSGKVLGLFRGKVTEIDEDETDGSVLYRIVYEDGDREDLNETECRSAIDLYKKIDSGEVNEWEIGGDE